MYNGKQELRVLSQGMFYIALTRSTEISSDFIDYLYFEEVE